MKLIDADALKELFSEVIGRIAKKPEMNGNLEHMIRASAMVIQMIDDAPTVQPDTTNHDSIPAETGKNNGDRTSGDCISRQRSVDTLRKMQTYKLFAGDDTLLINQAEAQTELMMLPSAEPEQRWIPVSEALPEEETDVLVTRTFLGCKDGSHGWNNHIPPTTYVEVAQYFNGEWTALSDEYKIARNRHTSPVAWMPLPEPYQAESEDEE